MSHFAMHDFHPNGSQQPGPLGPPTRLPLNQGNQEGPNHTYFDYPSPQSHGVPGTPPPAPMKGKFVVHDGLNGWEHWETEDEDSKFFLPQDMMDDNPSQQGSANGNSLPPQEMNLDTPPPQQDQEWQDHNLPSQGWRDDVNVFNEKRWDPFSEGFYTKDDFVKYYGDETFWNMNSHEKWAQRFMIETILLRNDYILCDRNVNHLLDKMISTFL